MTRGLGRLRFGHYHRSKVVSTGLVMFPMGSVTKRKLSRLPTATKCSSVSELINRKGFSYFLAVKFIRGIDSFGFIRSTDNFVQIIPLLEADGDLFPDSLQELQIYLGHDNVLGLLRAGDDLAPGTDHAGVSPGHVARLRVTCRAGRGHVHLVVQSSGT